MTEELRHVRRDLERAKEYLARAENRLDKVKVNYDEPRPGKLAELRTELERKFPSMKFTPRTLRLLRLVGTQPYNPATKDKEVIRQAIADKYL